MFHSNTPRQDTYGVLHEMNSCLFSTLFKINRRNLELKLIEEMTTYEISVHLNKCCRVKYLKTRQN